MYPERKASRVPMRLKTSLLMTLAATGLVACGGGDGDPQEEIAKTCIETGAYACKTGETEPLYTFQWALNYAKSYFQSHADAGAFGGGIDLNVEPVHRQGIKGQGVNVLVLDSGVDLEHEDLKANADYSMSWNYVTGKNDPNPLLTNSRVAHGTNVAGMIAAAQNGKGVMGLAPLARIGGGVMSFDSGRPISAEEWINYYGGAPWSRKAHVINASYGAGMDAQEYDIDSSAELIGLNSLKSLRDGKGIVFVKSAGNSFDSQNVGDERLNCGPLKGAYDCSNPADDVEALEPNVIVTAALNAKGQASSYSSAGSVVWITGMGGEYASNGKYGEVSGLSAAQIASGKTGDGPNIFSTDIRGCSEGYSKTDTSPYPANEFMHGLTSLIAGVKDNPNCDYSNMNGTSSAAPTITGVVALMLSANPDLSWRDVRDILRLSARAVDQAYEKRFRSDLHIDLKQPYNALFDLKTNSFSAVSGNKSHIKINATQVPFELGWTKNSAGIQHSNWYGFGVPDAEKAVELAKLYKKEPHRSKSAKQAMPEFTEVADLEGFSYQKVSLLGEFDGREQVVDQFQVRINARNICLGSVGIAVESPSGTKSMLKMPLDHFVKFGDPKFSENSAVGISDFDNYGAGSYAFYGENGKGKWKIYAVASNPRLDAQAWGHDKACGAAPEQGAFASDALMLVEARLIAQ